MKEIFRMALTFSFNRQVIFYGFETKKSCREPDPENIEDSGAIRTAIRSIWLWRLRRCDPVHYHGGKTLQMWSFFFSNRCWIGSRNRYSMFLWLLVAITFPVEGTIFAFFSARSPGKTHCLDFWSLVCNKESISYWRSRNDTETPPGLQSSSSVK